MKLQQAEFKSSTPEAQKKSNRWVFQLKNSSIILIGQNIYLHIFQLDFPLKNSIFVEPTKSHRVLKLLFKIIIIKIIIKIII